MRRAARVLIVCTANQFRSPMAELFFRRANALGEAHRGWQPDPGWSVCSAGTRAADGHPIHPVARRLLTVRGVDVGDLDGFRSRQLAPAMVEEADVILTLERTQRADVVALVPDALHRTFTLRQFARLAQAGTSAHSVRSADETMALVDIARRARSRSAPGDDDIPDSLGHGRRQVESTARAIEAAVGSIIRSAQSVPSTANLPV